MTRTKTAFAALALAAPALAIATPSAAHVSAQSAAWLPYSEATDHDTAANRRDRYRGYDDYDYGRGYDRDHYDDRVYRDTRVWQGRDGRYYCRRKDGTTGLIIGAAGGALLGREIAGRRGDRTLGAILGAAGGALLGREIDRGSSRCR